MRGKHYYRLVTTIFPDEAGIPTEMGCITVYFNIQKYF